MMKNDTLTTIEGLKVGHAEDRVANTGCTAILFEPEADIACDARGGWPGTYDTDSVGVGKSIVKKHAIFLTGGDVFGFDVAIGIRKFLLERKLAQIRGAGKLPGIVGANIYDLDFADAQSVNYANLGYRSCKAATNRRVDEGNVGAGIGATVGKFRGQKLSCKGGVGSSSVTLSNGISVGAIVVTNSMGNIFDEASGKFIAGARDGRGGFLKFEDTALQYLGRAKAKRNTTIGTVATNVELSHEQLIRVVQVAHDGLAISIRPAHMTLDGDTLFAATTAKLRWSKNRQELVDVVSYLATRCVASAAVRSARAARSLNGIPGSDYISDD